MVEQRQEWEAEACKAEAPSECRLAKSQGTLSLNRITIGESVSRLTIRATICARARFEWPAQCFRECKLSLCEHPARQARTHFVNHACRACSGA